MRSIFPLSHIRNVTLFYVLSAVYNMWFVSGVWIFIWGMFMSKTQIGISDMITFTIGFLVELPSGVIADIIGRKKAILFGNILLMLGNLCITFSSSFFSITFFYLIWTIGYAFQSGATEALAYDSVKKHGHEREWLKVISTTTVIGRTTSLLATALGGYLFAIWFRLPYLVFGITGIIGVIAAFLLQEIPVKHKLSMWSPSSYLKQIRDGLQVLVKPNVFPIALFSIAIGGISYMYNWGLLRPFTSIRYGFTATTYPLLLSAISLSVVMGLYVFSKIKHKILMKHSIFSMGLAYVALIFLFGFQHPWQIGGMLMIVFAIFGVFIEQIFSVYINAHTHQRHRATTLSAVTLFTKLPYITLAALTGYLAEKNLLPQFFWLIGIILFLVWVLSLKKYLAINGK